MCIRDSYRVDENATLKVEYRLDGASQPVFGNAAGTSFSKTCLLYTSDAADERSSGDLGGRRIIKKKKKTERDGA